MPEQIHHTLSQDQSLPVADRYRHLAAHYLLQNNLKKGCQALWASHSGFTEFLSLDEVKNILGTKPLPQWLCNTSCAARFPASLNPDETVGQQDWADHHLELSRIAINQRTRLLHSVVMNVFLGYYGFAAQRSWVLSMAYSSGLWLMIRMKHGRKSKPWLLSSFTTISGIKQ